MTRIRYEKKDGILYSKQFVAGPDLVQIIIDPVKLEGKLVSGDKHSLFTAKSLASLKKVLKETLVEMGTVFEPEVRPRLNR